MTDRRIGRERSCFAPTLQLTGALHPCRELNLVDLIILVDVQVPRVFALGIDRGKGA